MQQINSNTWPITLFHYSFTKPKPRNTVWKAKYTPLSNNLMLPFSTGHYQSQHLCGQISMHSSLHCCVSSLRFVGICLCKALLSSSQSISIRLRSELRVGLFSFFRHSVLDFLACFVLYHDLGQFGLSFSCQTNGLTFDFVTLWCTEELRSNHSARIAFCMFL